MHVKRYRKSSVREALRAAREELGADALVLATELVAAPGWRGWVGRREVQITAAVEREVSVDRQPATDSRPTDTDPLRAGVVSRLMAAGLDRALAEAVAAAI